MAGAIPVIRPLTQSLAGDTVLRVAGIVNGTTNHILSRWPAPAPDYAAALADASALGYAEADPTADVEGYDAPRPRPPSWRPSPSHPGDRRRRLPRGHHQRSPRRLPSGPRLGCTIKLLAICAARPPTMANNGFRPGSIPALVPLDPSAGHRSTVRSTPVVVEAEAAGRLDVLRPGRGGNRPRPR